MAHNSLSEKLDQITHEELGIVFEENQVWHQLEDKLGGQLTHRMEKRWMISACLFLAVCFLPFTVWKETGIQQPELTSVEEAMETPLALEKPVTIVESDTQAEAVDRLELHLLETRKVDITPAAIEDYHLLPISRIDNMLMATSRPEFSAQDISIIQSTLQRPTIRKDRKVIIRAEWRSSSEKSNVVNKSLKIKIADNHE